MHIPKLPNKHKFLIALTGCTLLAPVGMPIAAHAAVTQPIAKPRISFTFDDGLASTFTAAAPTLAANGLNGTAYVTSDCIGMTTAPNTCAADNDVPYMSWEQLAQLKNTYNWEIGGHTAMHHQLATDNLTDAQLTQEIAGGKQKLIDRGFNPVSFATPYGDYDNRALAEIAKSYQSHRGFWDVDNNVWPENDYLINNVQVQYGVSVDSVKAKIDQAIANKQWVVLTFHDIRNTPSTDPQDYHYATSDLNAIAAYAKSKIDGGQLQNVLVKDGLVTSTSNAFANSSFDNGLAEGWSTDSASAVTLDMGNKGSFAAGNAAAAAKSVKMTAGTTNAHLFSPQVTVDSTQTYMLKSYLNLTSRTSGELGYYIDEYDANGNWVSGQWKKAETVPFVKSNNFTYQPTNAAVKKIRLQVYVTANSGITAYLDNFQLFSLSDTTPPPSTTPSNILPNSNFDAGIGNGWTTDNSTAIKPDTGNHGAPENPSHAISMTAGTTNAHLFSPQVEVDNMLTYTIKAFLNILNLTSGEIGFYVDEYDAAGNWISGQYLTGKRTTGAETMSMAYTPSSGNVKRARVQIILVGNSGISAYVDNVQWIVPGGTTPPPDPTPTTVAVFEDDFATGFSKGWSTDTAANVIPDSTGKGSPEQAQHAVKLMAHVTKNVHLFAPQVTVQATKQYTISAFLAIPTYTSGEVAFYMDEYDTAGNWVSGKYITGVRAAGSQTLALGYTPTASNVAKASLQVIVTANSGITAYLDSIKWTTAA